MKIKITTYFRDRTRIGISDADNSVSWTDNFINFLLNSKLPNKANETSKLPIEANKWNNNT